MKNKFDYIPDCIGIITLPNDETLIPLCPRHIYDEIEEYCGEDMRRFIEYWIESLVESATEEELKFDSDFFALESELEELRSVMLEIQNKIGEYIDGLNNGTQKFSKQRVIPMLKNITNEIDEYL